MKFTCFIGIDIAKLTIDVAIYKSTNLPVLYEQFDNSASGFRALLAWINKHNQLATALFCLEHTGIYALPICCFLTQQKLAYSIQSALQVKKSMGIQRGKNDQADAKMLARYAYLYREEIKLSQVPSQTLMQIQHLLAYRQRLVKSKVALSVSASELSAFSDKAFSAQITRDSAKHIKQIQQSILSIDKQLETIIKEDEDVCRVYTLATAGRPRSVTGIGLQTAALIILSTNCFTSFDNWRQFVPVGNHCYSGTAPFEHSSGTSIRATVAREKHD